MHAQPLSLRAHCPSHAWTSAALGAALLCGPLWVSHAQSSLQLLTPQLGPEGLQLRWTHPDPGFAYTVQSRDALPGSVWLTPRSTAPWPITTPEWTDAATSGQAERFYRVLAVTPTERGQLIATQEVTSFSKFVINLLLAQQGLPAMALYDVRVHKLVYETVDPCGQPTLASGALILPQNPGRSLPLCSYQHGTIAKRTEAPSTANSNEQFLGAVLASAGYVTVLPDYLGLGDSTTQQYYHHAASEATAAVDMLRAARTSCAGRSVALNGQLFLLGYSHGGHATMALHRELEEYHAAEFPITASAPEAGAYDLSGVTANDVLAGRPMPNPYYFAMLIASYQAVYGLAPTLADLLAAPYASTLPPLLDGQHSGSEINAILPNDVLQVLKPEYAASFRANPDHPLRLALRDNDLYRWTPQAPMHLYHCAADEDVIFANAVVARDSFHARGATQVQLIDPNSAADHSECAVPALVLAKTWFDSLRN